MHTSSSRRPGALSILIGLAVPLAIAGILAWFGRTTMATVVASIGLAITLLRVAAPSYGQILMDALAAFGAWVGRTVSAVLLTLIYFTVFTPAAFLSRRMGRDPLALKPTTHPGWHHVGSDPSVRLFTHPFLRETDSSSSIANAPKVLRLANRVLLAIVLLPLLDMGLGAGVVALLDASGREIGDERLNVSVYDDMPWAEDYWAEFVQSFESRFEPYVGWRRSDFRGEYFNIVDGFRQGYEVAGAGDDAPLVFMFGGSTLWGTGGRDGHTIPSEIARLSEERGSPLRVLNLGESGWVSWQEALLLAHRLAMGERPDVVVFYDGANDTYAKLVSPDEYHPTQNAALRRTRFDAALETGVSRMLEEAWKAYQLHAFTQKVFRALWVPEPNDALVAIPGARPIDELASDLAEAYGSHVELVQALGRAYGFVPIFVWQPVAGTKQRRTAEEMAFRSSGGLDAAVVVRAMNLAGDELVARGLVRDFRRVIDGVSHTVYIDWAHMSEEGNRRVAEEFYPLIVDALSARDVLSTAESR